MENAKQITHKFDGVRLQIESPRPFEEVLRRLREQSGKSTVPQINEVAAKSASAAEFETEVTRRFVGSSGFMIFAEIEHTTWIEKYGINRKVLRVILGNPLYAITMLREDISAGLFAPVEILLVDNGTGSTLYYVRPSTLMVVTPNPRLTEAAGELDRKLDLLLSQITN
jgi:uncharacterized protein (DUF302 family)